MVSYALELLVIPTIELWRCGPLLNFSHKKVRSVISIAYRMTSSLIECVPNFSEGQNQEVIS
jgi:hypothetical protein